MLSFDESEAALRSGSLVVASTTRDVVVIDGPEAASYLHGQVSQNVEGLAIGTSAWTLLLEPVGRVTAWARVTRVNDERFWLDVDTGFGEAMMERLGRFKLRTKATFELQAAVPTAAVRGNLDVEAAYAVLADTEFGGVVADTAWPKSQGVDVLSCDPVSVAASLGAALSDPGIVELERIEAGRPAMGREFAEKTIPAETGVVDHSADFTKGCYVGQELVARVDSRGNNTPRTVYPASMSTSLAPATGTELTLDGEVVGMVTSATVRADGVAALVSLKRSVDVPVGLQVNVGGDVVDIAVTEVDWL